MSVNNTNKYTKQKEECEFPPFEAIMEQCKQKIEEKFKEYGNSWKTTDSRIDGDFWEERLQGELNEIKNSLHGLDHYQSAMECVDMINICAMIYSHEMTRHIHFLRMGRHGD